MSSAVLPTSVLKYNNRKRNFFIVFTSLILLVVSVFAYRYFSGSTKESTKFDFERMTNEMVAKLENKIATTINVLYDLRSEVSEPDYSSQEWHNFLMLSDIDIRYPNEYSVAYAERVPKGLLTSFENNLKEQEKNGTEYKSYFVFPKSENSEHYPIKYLHTNDKDISILLGFDLGYAPEISDALRQAIDADEPKISEKVSLSSIVPSSNQEGYFLILPAYSMTKIKDLPLSERRKYVAGMVVAWINPRIITKDISSPTIGYEVLDGDKKILTSSNFVSDKNSIVLKKEIKLLNKTFGVNFYTTSGFEVSSFEKYLPVYVLVIALLLNLMWYITVYLILSSRGKAINLAKEATSDLVKFKQAVDGVSDHVVITNTSGVIIYANRAAEKTTGYSDEEMIGRTPSIWGKQMSKEYYEAFWKTIKTDKKPYTGQLTNRRKTGELYEVEISVSPILDEAGNVEYFVGIERDITKQKALERMKTEFISLASHQLRTPLSAVKWFGKMLSDGDAGKLSPLQAEYMNKINDSNEREIKLVNSLLNVSRIESGRILVDPKPTDIKTLVNAVVNEVRVSGSGTKKEITWDVDQGVPEMTLDADLIRHVYMNLLTNAVRYTGDEGKIELKVMVRAGELVSEVKDNGIGIPPEEQSRVFEKFFRASNATKKETDGNGLGLYLAKTIVESSGGKMGFITKEGEGTTFWFTLPLVGMQKKSGELTMV